MNVRENTCRWAVISLMLVIMCGGDACADKTIYVDDHAAGANDGSSWTDAYKFLQDALADAGSADKPVEIRVAQGTYRPDQGTGVSIGNQEATFQLINGVTLRGGYAGLGQADPNTRDIAAYETILSGDLNGDDGSVVDWDEPKRDDNSSNVFVNFRVNESAILDGFTICGGNCIAINGRTGVVGGAGMDNIDCSPKVINCIFRSNAARVSGGGMCNKNGCPAIINCVFSNNSAGNGGAIYGGSGLISNCTFSGNSASGGGALMECNGQISDCTFNGNSARTGGAGVAGCHGLISNCTFVANLADYGAAIARCNGLIIGCTIIGNWANKGCGLYSSGSNPTLSNCTFAANSSPSGNAIACDSLFQRSPSNIAVTNCIFWGWETIIWNNDGSTITVSYSDVQGGRMEVYDPCNGLIWGDGNIDANPLFADPNNGDYHLKSQAGRWDSTSESWIKDDVTSPCIDAGDPNNPIGLEPFPNGGIINMGAYGGTAEASKSYFGSPVCETIVAGDINGDCKVDFADLAIMALNWLEDNTPVNSNSVVKDGIEYYIQTDKSVYHLGENVQMLYRVTNLTPNPVDIGLVLKGFAWVHFYIRDDTNNDIWQYVRCIPPAMYEMLGLEAGESKEREITWDMISDNETFAEPADDYPVGPGLYNIIGELELSTRYERVQVSVCIEVIPEPANSNSVVKDGIEYYIETDKSVYHLGEDVEILFRVTNVGENPTDIGKILNCEYAWTHFVITDSNNAEIWEYIRGIPPCGWTTLRLQPYEFREYQKNWSMLNDNGTSKKDDDFPVGVGSYNITGELELDGGYERVPVSVWIEIIPEPANSNSVVKDGIEYHIETDKSVYRLGEDVQILYRVSNLTENPVDIGKVPNCEYAYYNLSMKQDDNTDIWNNCRVIPPCGWTLFHLIPYESKQHQTSWGMTNDNLTLWPDDDYPVGPGSYSLTGELRLSNAYSHRKVPVWVRIEIIP